MWTYDTDSKPGTFFVYDDEAPETSPVIARDIRSEEHARLIAAAPELLKMLENFPQDTRKVWPLIKKTRGL